MRNLIVHGGISHPFEEVAQALAALLAEEAIESELSDDLERSFARLANGEFGMLTLCALRWRMLDHEKYAPYRDAHAMSLSESGRRNLDNFVRDGGAMLAIHTAAICFDDWPEWGDLLGARWQWGQSFHPPYGDVSVHFPDARTAVNRGCDAFVIRDEVFTDLVRHVSAEPLMFALAADQSTPQPVAWRHQLGAGRVLYDALGHDPDSINHPQHQRFIRQSARWLIGSSQEARD